MRASENKKTPVWLRMLLWLNILNSLALIGAYCGTHVSPNSFIYFAFLGLSYPIWLSIATVFMVFWFFVRPKWMLVSVVTLLLGFNHLRHFMAVTVSPHQLEEPIKIMSFNVKIFNLYDENRIAKRNGVFSFLKDEDPEIICFQEFYHQEKSTSFVTRDSMTQLLELPYYHERYTHELSDDRYFGVATFSKYPIVHKGEIPFDNDPNNFCIYSDVVIDDDTVRVFNAHIGSIRFQNDDYAVFGNDGDGPQTYVDEDAEARILKRLKVGFEKRAIQAETIATQIEASPYPVVLCGDLNDTPVSYCYRQFSQLLNDAFVESGNGIGTTYAGEMPSNRIDYIFHSESILSAHFKVHDVNFSDHLPISCSIDLP